MSTGYLVSLALIVAAMLGARWLFPFLPVRRLASPMTAADAVLAAVGMAGLVFHCGAMFFRSVVAALPGAGAVIDEIDALGTTSIIWYVGAAVLVLLALRHQHPITLGVVALALVAVGVTMYDGGSLQTHLAAIFILVLILAGVAAMLVLPPRAVRARGV